MQWQPVPRRDRSELSYSMFLREFALPGLPVIITGEGTDWPAKKKWATVDGLKACGIDLAETVQVQLGGDGVATLPLADCLDSFATRATRPATAPALAGATEQPGRRGQKRPASPSGRKSLGGGRQSASPRSAGVHPAIAASTGPAYLRNWRFHERNPHLLQVTEMPTGTQRLLAAAPLTPPYSNAVPHPQDFKVPPLFGLDFAVEAGLIQRYTIAVPAPRPALRLPPWSWQRYGLYCGREPLCNLAPAVRHDAATRSPGCTSAKTARPLQPTST